MSDVIEIRDDYSLPLKEIGVLLGIKPHDSFRVEILDGSTIQLKRISDIDPLIEIIDHPATLGKPISSEELRKLDDELWGS
jgi:hypothetical protein